MNPPAMQETLVGYPCQEDPWKGDHLPTPVFLGFPHGLAGKEFAFNVGDLGSIPGLGRSPREGKGYPLQYSGLENSMDYIEFHGLYGVRHDWANFTSLQSFLKHSLTTHTTKTLSFYRVQYIPLTKHLQYLCYCLQCCSRHFASVVSDSCNPMDCSLPGSSIRGIPQARILEWVAISFSRGSSPPRDQTWVSRIAGRLFTNWSIREAYLE